MIREQSVSSAQCWELAEKKLTRRWPRHAWMSKPIQALKKTRLGEGVKGIQTVIPEAPGLIKRGKHFQILTASHFELKLILWHGIQAISNVKLHKIIPNHNQRKHFPILYSAT